MIRHKMQNEFSVPDENNASFGRRFFIYQKERFPLIGHGLLVSAFSFSATAYSRLCRGADGFIPWTTFLIGIFTTVSLFLLVRIFDEFKDAEDDAKYRKNLPVPRGLVSLKELGIVGAVLILLQITINFIFLPKMLLIYFIIIAYLSLMGKEFFAASWLKKHQFWYVTSHMFIIPLIDIYSSGLDWLLEGVEAPVGLLFFFAVSYMNGIVIETGRKIRRPEDEAEGVLTYTSMLGTNRGVFLWLTSLMVTLLLSIAACNYAGFGTTAFIVLGIVFLLCATPALLFLKNKTASFAKMIEKASGIWTIAMYLTLGAAPMLSKLFSGT